jgi:biopolymer transport protein ExbD
MKRREFLTPDITPLIDVVFILLIFFLVSSVFKKEELALVLDLPQSEAKELEIEKKLISIEISPAQLAYMGKVVSFDELDSQLAGVKKRDQDIIVRIDKEVKYERVVKVLDILQKYSLNNLSLVTERKD